jgi:hypothetical protein
MCLALALEVNHPTFFPGTRTGVLARFLVQLVQLLFGQFQVNHVLASMSGVLRAILHYHWLEKKTEKLTEQSISNASSITRISDFFKLTMPLTQ